MSTSYQLTTLQDVFSKVPADRIQDCMNEIGKLFAETKSCGELMYETAKLLAEKDGKNLNASFSDSFKFNYPITWMDDGKGQLCTNFMKQNGETLMSVKIEKNDRRTL